MKKATFLFISLLIFVFSFISCSSTSRLVNKDVPSSPAQPSSRALEYYYQGYICELQGDGLGALEHYILAEYYDPEAIELKERLQVLHYNLSEYDAAVAKGKELIKSGASEFFINTLEIMINSYRALDQPDSALKYGAVLYKLHPSLQNVELMMWIYKDLGNISKAWQYFTLLRRHDNSPERFIYYEKIADVMFNNGRYDIAKELYQEILAEGYYPTVWEKLYRCYQATGEHDDAVKAFVNFYDYQPHDFSLLQEFREYLEENGRFDEYKEYYFSSLLRYLMWTSESGGLTDYILKDVDDQVEEYIESDGVTYSTALISAIIAEQESSYAEMLENLYTAIELNDSLTPYLWLARLYYRQLADTTRGDSILAAALNNFSDFSRIYFFWGNLLNAQGAFGRAISKFEKGLTYNRPSTQGLIGLGRAYEMIGQRDKSLLIFKKLVMLNPDNPIILNNLGYLLAEEGIELELAGKLIKKALSIHPGEGTFLDSYGWVLFKMGELDQARQYLEAAALELDDNPEVWEHLGDLHNELGNTEQAIEYWQKAIELETLNKEALREKIENAK